MKKHILIFVIGFCISLSGFSQETLNFTITPSPFNEDEQITLTFSNVNESVWGASSTLYLWTWSYDTNDLNSIDATNNGQWTDSSSATNPQSLTKNTDGTYSITLTPTTFYSRTGIGRIGFLVKNNTGSVQSTDMYAEVGTPTPPPTVTEEALPTSMQDGLNLDAIDSSKATLVLYAPGKQFVNLIGDFNNWTRDDVSYLLKKDSTKDRFWIELTGLTPQTNHMYQYLVDGELRIADPYSTLILDQNNDEFINNVTYPNLPIYPTGLTEHAVTVLRTGDVEFNWQITNFQKPAKTDLVIYEVLLRDFDALHSFDALKTRLDYIENLGVNAIELMPISEFDGNESWGYNPSFHMALDKYYGSKSSLKQLIDECHRRGIAVILDVVYNHASGQHPFYRMWNTDNGGYGGQASTDSPFFNAAATHSYSVFNDFNHSQQATKDYIKRTAQYWIDEYKIDGFRWDLTKGFTQNCSGSDETCTNAYQQDRVDVLQEYADYQWEKDPNFYVVFEHLGENTEETEWVNYRLSEGKGILMWSNLNHSYNEATKGFHNNNSSDFSWINYNNRGWSVPANIGYMESHDEERLMYNNLQAGNSTGSYDVKDLSTALDRIELAGAFYFTIPGPKMIWQFGELGYDVSINENGRTGNKPIRWNYVDEPDRKAVYDTWSKLITLKTGEAIFKTSDITLDVNSTTGLKTIHLTLSTASTSEIKYVTIVGNFGVTEQAINPKFQETGTWFEFLNDNKKIIVTDVNAPITLAPGAYKIYGDNPSSLFPNTNIPDDDNDGVANTDDVCPNTPLGTTVNVSGCEVFTLPTDNFTLKATSETCRTSNNGSISIIAKETLTYSVTVTGNSTNTTANFTTDYLLENLSAGSYTVCITVEGQANYEVCFDMVITEPEDIAVASKVNETLGKVELQLSGSNSYTITLNGATFSTTNSTFELSLEQGANSLKVTGDKTCQGSFEKKIYFGNSIETYPNPIVSELTVFLGNSGAKNTINIFSLSGKLIYKTDTNNISKKIDLSALANGIYILNVVNSEENKTFKILKK